MYWVKWPHGGWILWTIRCGWVHRTDDEKFRMMNP